MKCKVLSYGTLVNYRLEFWTDYIIRIDDCSIKVIKYFIKVSWFFHGFYATSFEWFVHTFLHYTNSKKIKANFALDIIPLFHNISLLFTYLLLLV